MSVIGTTSPSGWYPKLRYYLNCITVEPTMTLYMFAFMTTSVVEEAFFVNQACRVNHNLNASICDNISAKSMDPEIVKRVQMTVSTFQLWYDVSAHSVQIVIVLFLGAWSDRRGRKLPLLFGLCGKLYYSVMIVVNAAYQWPLEYVIYTAVLPMAFTGADVAIFAAAYTYLVDVTTVESRTWRITLLEVCYLATMPTGIALGSYLFTSVVQRSYAKMFMINCGIMSTAILYTIFRLDWQTSPEQRPWTEASNPFTDFFDYKHLVETVKALIRRRGNRGDESSPSNSGQNGRLHLLLLVLMMALYTFQRDEKSRMYLYTGLVFNWSMEHFSRFKTFQTAVQDLVLLLLVPLLSRVLSWRDTRIIMLGALAHAVARIFFASATEYWLFYVGGFFAAIGPIVAPVIRSMVSKIVDSAEKGKKNEVLTTGSVPQNTNV